MEVPNFCLTDDVKPSGKKSGQERGKKAVWFGAKAFHQKAKAGFGINK